MRFFVSIKQIINRGPCIVFYASAAFRVSSPKRKYICTRVTAKAKKTRMRENNKKGQIFPEKNMKNAKRTKTDFRARTIGGPSQLP